MSIFGLYTVSLICDPLHSNLGGWLKVIYLRLVTSGNSGHEISSFCPSSHSKFFSLKANNYRARSTFFPGGGGGGSLLIKLLRSPKYCKFVETVSLRWQAGITYAVPSHTVPRDLLCQASGFPLYHNCGVSHRSDGGSFRTIKLIGSSWYRQGVQTQALAGNSAVNITHPS